MPLIFMAKALKVDIMHSLKLVRTTYFCTFQLAGGCVLDFSLV